MKRLTYATAVLFWFSIVGLLLAFSSQLKFFQDLFSLQIFSVLLLNMKIFHPVFICLIWLSVFRLRDIGRSPWFSVLFLLPLFSMLGLIAFGMLASTPIWFLAPFLYPVLAVPSIFLLYLLFSPSRTEGAPYGSWKIFLVSLLVFFLTEIAAFFVVYGKHSMPLLRFLRDFLFSVIIK
nr:DUF805 domain-containing protein [Stenoxybacter acetivorans]